tara:strand:+ start:753 stop:1022 length:270 start_codon:yes stop_codon:yes gene_type:complete
MVEEIISHTLDNDRGSINIEFLYSNNDNIKTLNVEAFLDELEDYGDLYEETEWVQDDDEVSLTFHRQIDLLGLQESLTNYIQDNPTLLD